MRDTLNNWIRSGKQMDKIGLAAWIVVLIGFVTYVLRPRFVIGGTEPLVFGWIPTWLFRLLVIVGVMSVMYLIIFIRTTKVPPDFLERIEEET